MNQAKAETVLRAVEKKYDRWIGFARADGVTDPDAFPKLVENFSYGIEDRPAPFAVVWEYNAPDDWAMRWGSAKREDPPGTFCEPVYEYVLGIYNGE